jgi:hypothetical protein
MLLAIAGTGGNTEAGGNTEVKQPVVAQMLVPAMT